MEMRGHGGLGRAGATLGVAIGFLVAASVASATTTTLGKAGGLKYVRATGTVGAAGLAPADATVQARCGASAWRTTGGGVALAGSAPTAYLSQSSDFLHSWYGTGWHRAEPARRLSVFGICSKNAAFTHKTRLASFPPAPPTSVAYTVNPCAGDHVLGGGTLATTGASDRFINTTNPYDGPDADKALDDGWQAYQAILNGSGSILVYSVCKQGPMPAYRSAQRTVEDHHVVTASARCTSGHVAGGGVYVTGPATDAHLVASRPIDAGDSDRIPDDGWSGRAYNRTGGTQTVTVTAICIG